MTGFIVTWDVDSRDPALCARVRRFVFGYELRNNGKVYRYPGFVDREGVRYVGQSVLFVTAGQLPALRDFLQADGIDHVLFAASVGSIMPC